MPLSFPLTPPAVGPASEYFEIERVDHLSPQTGGRVSGVTAGFPLWRGRWSLGRALLRATSEDWRAFVSSLRGGQRAFFGRDYGRPFPLAYPKGFLGLTRFGGGAFDGTATSWSVNADRDEVTLNGLPANLVLSVGDYVMWKWTGAEISGAGTARRALVRAVQAATASASGVAVVTVEPPLPTLVPSGAGSTADLANPCCVMRLDTSQTSLGEKTRSLRIDGTIAAVQDLRA